MTKDYEQRISDFEQRISDCEQRLKELERENDKLDERVSKIEGQLKIMIILETTNISLVLFVITLIMSLITGGHPWWKNT